MILRPFLAGLALLALTASSAAQVPTVKVTGTVTVGPHALTAGSAIIGKVGIDQTTPGTTNKVSIGSDGTVGLVAGTAIAGKFGIDQTTPGTTNKVSIGTDGTVTVTGVATEASLGDANDKLDDLLAREPAALTGGGAKKVAVVDAAGNELDYAAPTTDTAAAAEVATASNNNECMAANASAKYRAIANPLTGSMMRVQFGATVSATDYWEYIAPGETWAANTPFGVWRGIISCQWVTATGDSAIITQLE